MTKKHYTEVAEMLAWRKANALNPSELDAVRQIALDLALIFKRSNPRFRAGTFFDAAGFPELTNTAQGLA